jgi:hypothetical protein
MRAGEVTRRGAQQRDARRVADVEKQWQSANGSGEGAALNSAARLGGRSPSSRRGALALILQTEAPRSTARHEVGKVGEELVQNRHIGNLRTRAQEGLQLKETWIQQSSAT